MTDKSRSLCALLLLVPAPSLGALAGMRFFPNSLLGTVLFAASKCWLLILPIVWLKLVDKRPFSLSPVKKGGFGVGVLTGLGISAVIVMAYLLLGDRLISKSFFLENIAAIGLSRPLPYILGALYWITVNSVLEEYVWRWFCTEKTSALLPRFAAIVCSGLFFTLHHVIALQVYMGIVPVIICSLGVFIGAAIWSAMYLKYRSIWPGYVSHALVDLCVFSLGAFMIFGS